jgi:hypothetical protein
LICGYVGAAGSILPVPGTSFACVEIANGVCGFDENTTIIYKRIFFYKGRG